MADLKLQCQCGQVLGRIINISIGSGNHLFCYCRDCQAFPEHLNKADTTLDSAGGTEIYQISPDKLKIDAGTEQLACLRLTEKGLYRWYAKCCNTPIGNTVGPKLPFVGIIHTFFAPNQDVNKLIGEPIGNYLPQQAIAEIPDSPHKNNSSRSLFLRVLRKLLWWKLSGKGNPNPLFENGKPIAQPEVVEQ